MRSFMIITAAAVAAITLAVGCKTRIPPGRVLDDNHIKVDESSLAASYSEPAPLAAAGTGTGTGVQTPPAPPADKAKALFKKCSEIQNAMIDKIGEDNKINEAKGSAKVFLEEFEKLAKMKKIADEPKLEIAVKRIRRYTKTIIGFLEEKDINKTRANIGNFGANWNKISRFMQGRGLPDDEANAEDEEYEEEEGAEEPEDEDEGEYDDEGWEEEENDE